MLFPTSTNDRSDITLFRKPKTDTPQHACPSDDEGMILIHQIPPILCLLHLRMSCKASSNFAKVNVYPFFSNRSGKTHLLFKSNSVSVRIMNAPISNNHSGDGKPKERFITFLKVAINSRFVTGCGEEQLKTPFS